VVLIHTVERGCPARLVVAHAAIMTGSPTKMYRHLRVAAAGSPTWSAPIMHIM
jgi:hypothetical protein